MTYYERKARKCAIDYLGEYDAEQWEFLSHWEIAVRGLATIIEGAMRVVARDQRHASAAGIAGLPHEAFGPVNSVDAHSVVMNAKIEDVA